MMGRQSDLSKIGLDVSRETLDAIERYLTLLSKWNPVINLVSKGSLASAWERHILDSAQICPMLPASARVCVDIGSGGGLPGIVLAIISREHVPERRFTFVESDQRKAAFLREVTRTLDLPVTVIVERIEDVQSLSAEVLSARALAPLPQLLQFAKQHLAVGGMCIFQKGETYLDEIEAAQQDWSFDFEVASSKVDSKGVTLLISGITNA